MNHKKFILSLLISFVSATSCMDDEKLGQNLAKDVHTISLKLLDALINNATNMVSEDERNAINLNEFNQKLEAFKELSEGLKKDKTYLKVFFDLKNLLVLNDQFVTCVANMTNQKEVSEDRFMMHFCYIGQLSTLQSMSKPCQEIIQHRLKENNSVSQ